MIIRRSFQKEDEVVEEFYDAKVDEGQNRRSDNKDFDNAKPPSF